jgi:hypothetical protein
MQPATIDSPHIPLRSGGWPTRRSPRWLFAAGAVLLVIAIAIGLSHRPTRGERATDLRGLLQTVKTDVQSCSGGVGESLKVLRAIDSGTRSDVATAVIVANTASANCSPANNEQLDDLTGVQVPESLASYHLQAAVTKLIAWAAPRAIAVSADVATVLSDRGKPAEAAARAALSRSLRALDAQRAAVDAAFRPAIAALTPRSTPPVLHG